jgi:UDP-N-acetyl-alpha-D-muramoyl-L-alanyl-L-glutamate epimerase
MIKSNNSQKFLQYRQKYLFFVYKGFDHQYTDKGLRVQYHFSLGDEYTFHPTLIIPDRDFFLMGNLREGILENLLFHIGMIELISYWKAACPPTIRIECGSLDDEQVKWWKKLYYYGLGEFFYLNSIDTDLAGFVNIISSPGTIRQPFSIPLKESTIIPIGGGKDSVVTLEILSNLPGNIPMVVNPRPASTNCIMKRGYFYDSVFEINRTIDPILLDLNNQGFLNGHTPFSALLAFISALAAVMTGRKYIALSNESSANEATIPGSEINHQYSKSIDFEGDFRWYLKNYITPDLEYFSFLRPLNEMQIARIFSGFPAYFPVFRSCNAGSKTDSWCGKCPKCLFTLIILSPFIPFETLESIFGKNLLDDPALLPVLYELTGISGQKPFDCIGTVDEVNAALVSLVRECSDENLPFLLREYKKSETFDRYQHFDFRHLLENFSPGHFLPPEFEKLLRTYLDDRFSEGKA